MDSSTAEELHPNWRALATIHLPLKRFVHEGAAETARGTANDQGQKYKIQGVHGEELSKFYDEIVKEDKTKKTVKRSKRLKTEESLTNVKISKPKAPFDSNKYFRFAMSNNVEELTNFDFQADDLNTRDGFGWTALMMAACAGASEAVESLLDLGVNRHITDKSGSTAMDFARKKGHFRIVDILQSEKKSFRNEKKSENHLEVSPVEPFYCTTCQTQFTETTLREHQTSTVHQFNEKSTLPANKLQKFNITPKNRGLKLMMKLGWDKESGLGPSNSGRLYPVKTVIRKQRSGLGIEQPPARVTHFEAFDLRATQRHNSNFYNKKPRNSNDMKREKVREWKRSRRLRNELS